MPQMDETLTPNDSNEEPLGTISPGSSTTRSRPRPVEPPATEMEAIFELGATQEAVLKLRREVQTLRAEMEARNGDVADLRSSLTQTEAELREVLAEERQARTEERQYSRASTWERFLGGSG